MLLQLENTHKDNVEKLISFAKENHLNLSLVDEDESNYILPGKPLSKEQLLQLIETSRKSGIISMKNAHEIITVLIMQIDYTTEAFVSLVQLVNYIEFKNTQGAGLRWLKRFETFLVKKLHAPLQIKLCNNETFHQLNLRCVYFNEWIIAFSIHEDAVLIEALLHKSRITD